MFRIVEKINFKVFQYLITSSEIGFFGWFPKSRRKAHKCSHRGICQQMRASFLLGEIHLMNPNWKVVCKKGDQPIESLDMASYMDGISIL